MSTANSDLKKIPVELNPVQLLLQWESIFSDFKLLILENPTESSDFKTQMSQFEIDIYTAFRKAFGIISTDLSQIKESDDIAVGRGQDNRNMDIHTKEDNVYDGLLETVRPHPDPGQRFPGGDEHQEKKPVADIDPASLKNPGVLSEKDKGDARPSLLPNGGNGLKNPMNR